MKASYNWLKEFVDFDHLPEKLAELMTNIGLNVEGIDEVGLTCRDVVVGKVLTCKPVPKTDHLSYCEVDVGTGEPLGIVCGAPNVAEGQIVPVALVGAELAGGFKIEKRKLRGVVSTGMICSEKELGISEEAAGIMVLEYSPLDFTPIEGTPPLVHPYNSRGGEGESFFKIGAPLTDYVGKQDWIFDVEVTINRPDCLSHLGMAREISAATGLELKMPSFELQEDSEPAEVKITIEIEAPDKCPRYSVRIVEGVKVAPSPLWMQDRLRNLGVRPISNIVDVTNYVLLELGHPLHAFDYHFIAEQKIIVRTAEDGEKFITLDDDEHKLQKSDLLIADSEKGIALAGVMGGLNSEIMDDTEDVLLECAYFEPVGIRITSRDRGISSESSYRFERGVDPEMTLYAVDRAAYLVHEYAGGRVLKGVVDNYPKQWQSKPVKLRTERVNKLLATNIHSRDIAVFLERLGCKVKTCETFKTEHSLWREDFEKLIKGLLEMDMDGITSLPMLQVRWNEKVKSGVDFIKGDPFDSFGDIWKLFNKLQESGMPESDISKVLEKIGCNVSFQIHEVTPPSWRHDLDREIDLVEEIARLHGYDRVIPAASSGVPLLFDEAKERPRRLVSRFKQALVELGFREIISPSLVPQTDAERYPYQEKPVKLLNPLSEDLSHLRIGLGPSLLRAAVRNLSAGQQNIRIFEWGKSFRMDGGTVGEGWRLAGLLTGNIRPESWIDNTRELGFFDLKGLIELFLNKISLDKPLFNPYDIAGLSDGCGIFVDMEDRELRTGQFGLLDPAVCETFGVDIPVWFFEFDGDILLKVAGAVPQYRPLPRYPSARRDLAFQVDAELHAERLEEILRKHGGKQLETLELFDLFSGKGIPAGKKSLAYHLTFRSTERTLSDTEVDRWVKQMIDGAAAEVGAVLRS
ncbi:phenylalanine--tRNA ligase subunit beta [bacterium]|nr:phenylalanine--tRNA ligase subunit beta [bacterium]